MNERSVMHVQCVASCIVLQTMFKLGRSLFFFWSNCFRFISTHEIVHLRRECFQSFPRGKMTVIEYEKCRGLIQFDLARSASVFNKLLFVIQHLPCLEQGSRKGLGFRMIDYILIHICLP